MRWADDNMVTFADVLQHELLIGSRVAWQVYKSGLEAGRPRLTRVARFCPQCLEARRYWLDSWEVPLADACSECGRWLVDECGKCGKRVTWKRAKLLECDCGASLAAEPSSEAPPAVVELSRTLVARAQGRVDGQLEMLMALNLEECLQLCNFFAAVAGRTPYKKLRSLSELEQLDRSWNISSLAAEVIVGWPHSFIRSLRDLNRQAPEGRRGSLVKVFGNAYLALHNGLRSPKFEFLRSTFASYLSESWTGTVAKRNRAGIAELSHSMAWIPAAAAARILGVSAERIRKLADEGKLPSECRTSEKGRRFVVVSKEAVLDNEVDLRGGYTLTEAASMLGLPDRRLAYLLTDLQPDVFIPNPGAAWSIPAEWVHRWQLLASKAPHLPQKLAGETCTLRWALRNMLTRKPAALAVLRDIFEGGSMRYWRTEKSSDIGSLALLWSEVCDIEEGAAASPPAAIYLPNAAKLMSVKEEVIYSLTRTGLLRTAMDKSRHRQRSFTTEEWLKEFSEKYVLGRDVAASLRRSPRYIATWLRAHGVLPVAGPGVDQCRQLVYEWERLRQFKEFAKCRRSFIGLSTLPYSVRSFQA